MYLIFFRVPSPYISVYCIVKRSFSRHRRLQDSSRPESNKTRLDQQINKRCPGGGLVIHANEWGAGRRFKFSKYYNYLSMYATWSKVETTETTATKGQISAVHVNDYDLIPTLRIYDTRFLNKNFG